jgi:acyl-CoA synthetase (AMP-forming)/AMP-acid ligase II
VDSIPWGSELWAVANRHAEDIAVRDGSGAISYRTMFRKAAALALTLRAAEVNTGEPVATFFGNGASAAWTHYGVLLAGAADVPINPALSETDVRTCLAIARARRVVTALPFAGLFQNLELEVFCAEDTASTTARRATARTPAGTCGATANLSSTWCRSLRSSR